MNTNFDRIFNLAKKSQSRLVVFDKEAGNHFVVLGIDDFEGLLDGPVAPKISEPEPPAPVMPLDVPEQFVDSTRAEDEALLQKLNQQIAEWRQDELKKAVVETAKEVEVSQDIPVVSVVEEPKIIQPITKPVKIEPEPEEGGWHKLGDVIAGASLGKVSYEPLGEQGIKPTLEADEAEYAEPEPLNDDPVFLEEPIS